MACYCSYLQKTHLGIVISCPNFHGRNDTVRGQNGIRAKDALCYTWTYPQNQSFKLEEEIMRHFYFRLVLGIVFLLCAVYSFVTANIAFAMLYIILGAVFLFSAYTIWKKNKENRG